MRKQLILLGAILSFSSICYANWFQDIINVINKQASVSNDIMNNQLSIQQDMFRNQKAMQYFLDQINANTSGHSGYGSYQFHDYQSYGVDANDWSSVINMAERGHGNGALGGMIGSIKRDFPFDSNVYNRGVRNSKSQQYYATKSKTIIAARAASELDYNKIQQQIAYQQLLMQQIEKTKDIKAAMDLANRIHLEGNLINLEILRQSALINQQQAITEQASVMSALSNAKFITKE